MTRLLLLAGSATAHLWWKRYWSTWRGKRASRITRGPTILLRDRMGLSGKEAQ